MSDLITATEAASLLGVASGRVARQTLARWGVRPVGRAPGRGGESLYPRDVVVEALRRRPGQGARTDLAATKKKQEKGTAPTEQGTGACSG